MTAYVPAVDLDEVRRHFDLYRDHQSASFADRWACCAAHYPANDVPALIAEIERLRRLYVRVEPAPFVHSDMCEDDGDDEPMAHLGSDGDCLCWCPKCDKDGYCVCPMCSRPASHPHRPDPVAEFERVLDAETHDDLRGAP